MEHDTTGIVVERSLWRSVALPSEHGGWGLTLEPVLLGLLVAWSTSGVLLGVVALGAFLVRTPLKLAVIDRRRDRWLDRSRFAVRVAAGEAMVVAVAALGALHFAGWRWLVPLACAAPLVAVEWWFDIRSRGRRLVPELCGAIGIASVAAAIVVAGGGSTRLAVGTALVLAARSVAAIPFVRMQIVRMRRGSAPTTPSVVAQAVGLAIGVAAAMIDHRLAAGAVALGALVGVQLWWHRAATPDVPAKVIGLRQLAMGIGLVVVTAGGVMLS